MFLKRPIFKVISHFASALTVSKIKILLTLRSSKSRWRSRSTIVAWQRSIANVKMYRRLLYIFALALTVSEILKFKMFDLQKVRQGNGVQFSHWYHSIANVKFYKILPQFCASSNRFRYITMLIVWPLRSRSRSRCTIFALTPFNGKCQHLQMLLVTFSIFIKVCLLRTITTDRRKRRHKTGQGQCNFADLPKYYILGQESNLFELFVQNMFNISIRELGTWHKCIQNGGLICILCRIPIGIRRRFFQDGGIIFAIFIVTSYP